MLSKGITGFWGKNTAPPSVLGAKAFRQMCHTLARENGAAVPEINMDITARNFYFARIQKYDDTILILQNVHSSYAAFAQQDALGRLVFVQQPAWFRFPEGHGCFLHVDELEQDWRSLCGELSPKEQEQICYWKPQTVGELLFNTWD